MPRSRPGENRRLHGGGTFRRVGVVRARLLNRATDRARRALADEQVAARDDPAAWAGVVDRVRLLGVLEDVVLGCRAFSGQSF